MPYDAPASARTRRLCLPQRESLMLDNAEGTVIAVDSGCLWVTMERDPRDVVLLPGMRFEIDRSGRTIVAAEEDSRFRLSSTSTPARRVAAWLARQADRLSVRWGGRQVVRVSPYY